MAWGKIRAARRGWAAAVLALALHAATAMAQAPTHRTPADSGPPTLVSADEVQYDRANGIVRASGNVEISRDGRILLADTVTYNERTDIVIATGNVSLMETSGDVLFADYAELRDGMRNGFIRAIRVLLSDNSRFAADEGERLDGNKTTLSRAVYSPCNLCPTDPTRAPLWQVKAVRVIHNQEAQRIEYKDAVFEIMGVPAAYTPYFSHPDPTVKRQSGLLPMSVISNNFFGVRAQTPYFWAIGPDRDATITPQVSTLQGVQLAAEYRQRMTNGELHIDGSYTPGGEFGGTTGQVGNDSGRGHFRSLGRFRVTDNSRAGFNVFRASDETYLRRYEIPGGSTNSLTSRVFFENINDRDFAAANAYVWQSMIVGERQGTLPYVLPVMSYSHVGEPDLWGGRLGVDAGLLSLYRTNGEDVRRASLSGNWQRTHYANAGDVYTLTAQLRGEAYWVNEGNDPANPLDARDSDISTRVQPLLSLDWRYPFVRGDGETRQLVEPVVSLVATPYGGNSVNIPNEDSQLIEFDDTNLFALSRFPGLDRYDGGPRANIGVRTGIFGERGRFGELLVGQSLRLRDDTTFPAGSGLNKEKSDYVGRLSMSPVQHVTLIDRVRLDQSSLGLRRHEIIAGIGPPAFNISLSYAALDKSLFSDELGNREAASITAFARLTQHWSVSASHFQDLGPNGGSLRSRVGLRYTDECLDVYLFADRDFTTQGDLVPSTTYGIRFRLLSFN
jgi:LPS-assembly protein